LHEKGGGCKEAEPVIAITIVVIEEKAEEKEEEDRGIAAGHTDAETDQIVSDEQVEEQGRKPGPGEGEAAAEPEEEQGCGEDEGGIDEPYAPGAGDIQEVDERGFMIENIAVGNAAGADEAAEIAEDLDVVIEGVYRWAVEEAEPDGGEDQQEGNPAGRE